MPSLKTKLLASFTIYKDPVVWINVMADTTPPLIMLMLFLIPGVRDFLGSFSFTSMWAGYLGSNLPNHMGVQMLSVVASAGIAAGIYMSYVTMLWAASSTGLLLLIVFVVLYSAGVGCYGDKTNGLAIIFSMGFGIFFVTGIAFAYRYHAPDVLPSGLMERRLIEMAGSLSKSITFSLLVNSLVHVFFSFTFRIFARDRFARKVGNTLKILSKLIKLDRTMTETLDKEELKQVDQLKATAQGCHTKAAWLANIARLDEVILCSKRGKGIAAMAQALQTLSSSILTLSGMSFTDIGMDHNNDDSLSIMLKTNFLQRFPSIAPLYKPFGQPESIIDPILESKGVLEKDSLANCIFSDIITPASQYLEICAQMAQQYPNGENLLPESNALLEKVIDTIDDLVARQCTGEFDENKMPDIDIAIARAMANILVDFHHTFSAWQLNEIPPEQQQFMNTSLSQPYRSLLQRLTDFLASDVSIRCFRFAIGGTILCGLALSPETDDAMFSFFGVSAAMFCFFSVSAEATISAMLTRLIVRMLGICLGVVACILTWLSMGGTYHLAPIIVGHVILISTCSILPHMYNNTTPIRLLMMMVVGGYVMPLDSALLIYWRMGVITPATTAYSIGAKFIIFNLLGAAIFVICNLIILPKVTKDVVRHKISDALKYLRLSVVNRIRRLVKLDKISPGIGSESSATLAFASSVIIEQTLSSDTTVSELAHIRGQVSTALMFAAEITLWAGLEPPIGGKFQGIVYNHICRRILALSDWLLRLDVIILANPEIAEKMVGANGILLDHAIADLLCLISISLDKTQDITLAIQGRALSSSIQAFRLASDPRIEHFYIRIAELLQQLANDIACDIPTVDDDLIRELKSRTVAA